MARILLLGANGQVGWELQRSLLPIGGLTTLTRADCDFTDRDQLVEFIRAAAPETIVNAAAYTAVDRAEEDTETARRVNADVPEILAAEALRLGALLVDYSTDYVFDGSVNEAYVETDQTNPVNAYGRTKLAGQRAIEQSGCRYLIFRVSWVYGYRGHNFLKTMLHLGRQRDELRVVSDQAGSPTPADFIADVTAQALLLLGAGKGEEGLFHLAPAGATTWYEFAVEIFRHAATVSDYRIPKVTPIKTAEYPTPAKRPLNSRLDTSKIERTFAMCMPEWRVPMKRVVEEVVAG